MQDLFSNIFDEAGSQLSRVLDGFPAAAFEKRNLEQEMTPAETVAHLTECHIAGQKELRGEQHDWGSYEPQEASIAEKVARLEAERASFKAAVVAAGNPEAVKAGVNYGAAHDFYHIGQLCTLRRVADPEWDPYSIYAH